jgi:acyl carrier protein
MTGNPDGYVGPGTELEARIAGIWAEVLGLQRVSIRDDFLSIGGTSLSATLVMNRLFQEFPFDDTANCLLEDVTTVEELARRIGQAIVTDAGAQPPENDRKSYREIVDEIQTIVAAHLARPAADWPSDPEQPLLGGGVNVSSLAALELLTAIERQFGVEFGDAAMAPSLFTSVSSLASAVHAMLSDVQDGNQPG